MAGQVGSKDRAAEYWLRWRLVLQRIRADPMAVDAQLSFFAAAVKSYRWDSLVKPFPPMFLQSSDNEKDVERLRLVFDRIPPLQRLLVAGERFAEDEENSEAIDLLSWIFSYRHPRLKSTPLDTFKEIDRCMGTVHRATPPDYIFEVCRNGAESGGESASSDASPTVARAVSDSDRGEDSTSPSKSSSPSSAAVTSSSPGEGATVTTSPPSTSSRRENFARLAHRYGSFMAYHGSRAENFHSILHSGLIAHLNKTSLFGYGTYLSTALPVAASFSLNCAAWPHSVVGMEMSCVAICEIADHPEQVKRSAEDPNSGSPSTSPAHSGGHGDGAPTGPVSSVGVRSRLKQNVTEDGTSAIPDKYIVVSNNDLLRLRYVLVYGHRKQSSRSSQSSSRIKQLWKEHQFAVVLACYTLILVVVGLLRSDLFGSFFSPSEPPYS